MLFIVTFLLLQSFYIFASDDDDHVPYCKNGYLISLQGLADRKEKADSLMEDSWASFNPDLQSAESLRNQPTDNNDGTDDDALNRIMEEALEQQGFVSVINGPMDVVNRIGAAPAASSDSSDCRPVRMQVLVQENPQLKSFYESRLDFVQQKKPELLPYFDRDILSLLACTLDKKLLRTAEDKDLFQVYLWRLFLDTYNELLKKLYTEWLCQLELLYLSKVIPHQVRLSEDGVYKNFVKNALSESLSEGLLEYTTDINSQGIKSFVLSPKSKLALVNKISGYAKEYISSEIKKHYSLYEPYTPDKSLKWVSEYMNNNQQGLFRHPAFIKGLYKPTILNRIAYDLAAIKKMNMDNKDLATMDEENSKALTFFYGCFYKKILEGIYKGISKFTKDHSIDLQDEKIFSYIEKFFESFQSNLFHINQNNRIEPLDGISFFIVDNVTKHFNDHIKKLKEENSQKYASVPFYIHWPDNYTPVQVEDNSGPIQNFREQPRRVLESKALAAASYQQQLAISASQSQEYDRKQQEKIAREKKAAENQAKREQAEKERLQQAEQEEAARKKREQERNKARDVAAKQLCLQRDSQIEKMREKSSLVYEIEEKMRLLSVSCNSKKKLEAVRLEIKNKTDRLNNSKDLKKELGLFDNDISSIEKLIRELEEILEHEKKQSLIELDEQQHSNIEEENSELLLGAPAAYSGAQEVATSQSLVDQSSHSVLMQNNKQVRPLPTHKRLKVVAQENSEDKDDYSFMFCTCLNNNPSMLGPFQECCHCRSQKPSKPMNPEAAAFIPSIYRRYGE